MEGAERWRNKRAFGIFCLGWLGRWHKIDICVGEAVRHLLYMALYKALSVNFGIDLNY